MIFTIIGLGSIAAGGMAVAYIAANSIQKRAECALAAPAPYRIRGRLVSVIIPSLQEERNLPYLLTSIRNQTYEPIEVVIADSSASPSREKIELISKQFGAKYVFAKRLNVAYARNAGAKQSHGDVLVFIDADCFIEHQYIEKLVTALEEGYLLSHGVEVIADGMYYGALYGARVYFKPYDYTTGRGVAIWRNCFYFIGGYDDRLDPTLGYREDLDLGKRIKEYYGPGSIKLLRDAGLVTWGLREKRLGLFSWSWRKVRGVRNGIIPV